VKPNISRVKMEIESDNDPFFMAKFEYAWTYAGAMSISLD
jgi:hypothetical protein